MWMLTTLTETNRKEEVIRKREIVLWKLLDTVETSEVPSSLLYKENKKQEKFM